MTHPPLDPVTHEPVRPVRLSGALRLRQLVGIALGVSLILIFGMTLSRDEEVRATTDASIVQLMQVYIEGVFWSVTAIGLAIGVYVFTRTQP